MYGIIIFIMPRMTRIESSDGLYHVLNRGNYRNDIFETDEAKRSFEKTMLEACDRCGWELYAYAIMRNHFHLAIGTPRGNLISGMQWLQATFASRFNRYRKEHGVLFQGRYKSLIIEPGSHLCQVVNYIHLNPVRAGIVKVGNLGKYPFCSFAKYKEKPRPKVLHCKTWLRDMERLKDTQRGWWIYRKVLEAESKKDALELERIRKQMTRGWCIGDKKYREQMAKEIKKKRSGVKFEKQELREINELHWEEIMNRCLNTLEKTDSDIQNDKKSAEWKLAIVSVLKKRTAAPNAWISKRLNMGVASTLSSNLSNYLRGEKH